jgi:hypothetical protein
MITIEMASYLFDYPGKGHDRVFTDAGAGVMAILDGAGSDAHSGGAILALEEAVKREAHPSDEGAREEFDYLSSTSFSGAHLIRYTSAVAGYDSNGSKMSAGAIIDLRSSYDPKRHDVSPLAVNRGDTSIFAYNRDWDEFKVIADAASRPIPVDGRVDTSDFFGCYNTRTQAHPYAIAKMFELLVIPGLYNERFDDVLQKNVRYDDELIIVATTDGIYEGEPLGNRGISLQTIEEIMRTSNLDARGIAEEIGNSVMYKYDDASAIVCRIEQRA